MSGKNRKEFSGEQDTYLQQQLASQSQQQHHHASSSSTSPSSSSSSSSTHQFHRHTNPSVIPALPSPPPSDLNAYSSTSSNFQVFAGTVTASKLLFFVSFVR
jgi:hypothetical protein